MHRVLLLGAGKIGRMIARLLVDSGDYGVIVGDVSSAALERIARRTGVETRQLDVESAADLAGALAGCDTVISALSYFYNPGVAEAALAVRAAGTGRFRRVRRQPTSACTTTSRSQTRCGGELFMPQCGRLTGQSRCRVS